MSRFKDQAICIRHGEWSETSQLVVLMTEQLGKVRGLAKGSKRTSPSAVQRYSGGIELLTRGEIVGVLRSNTELVTLIEWDLQDDFRHLHTDFAAQQQAFYAADVVNALMADQDAHPRTFHALRSYLEALRQPSGWSAALLRFQWTLLDDAGYRPELFDDVHSGDALPNVDAYTFDPVGGGLTQRDGRKDWRVRRQTVELLRHVSQGDEPAATEDALSRANRLLCVYLRTILDQELPTMRVVLGR
ncbi:DNA repair protein RecO [Phycisphaerales bacterium AB-hyl4]|uniref:DNA repair protein RecO n=1 Tax=Natronomicrosphaera hydrolytica TaxID=3242702 RepID=A0ABV4U2R8_9BACT